MEPTREHMLWDPNVGASEGESKFPQNLTLKYNMLIYMAYFLTFSWYVFGIRMLRRRTRRW